MIWKPPKLPGRSSMAMGGGLVLLIAAVTLVSALAERRSRMAASSRLTPGAPLPPYSATHLDGSEVSLRSWLGSVVLLTFWSRSCGPCERQLPGLRRLHEELAPRGLELVSVSLDDPAPNETGAYLVALGCGWTNLFGSRAVAEEVFGWGPGLPKSVLVHRDGTVAAWWWGARDPHTPDNWRLITAALDGGP